MDQSDQVERWFAAVTEQQIRRGKHRSTSELEQAVEEYMAVYSEDPKLLIWTHWHLPSPAGYPVRYRTSIDVSGSTLTDRSPQHRANRAPAPPAKRRPEESGL